MLDRRVSEAALLLLPAGLVVYLAFNAGGFFPAECSFIAVVLAVILTLRVLGAAFPFAGAGSLLVAAVALMALLTLLTLFSEAWSHADGQAVVAFDRTLMYLLALVLFGCLSHTRARLAWLLRGLAVAATGVCACSLITRLLPDLWPVAPNLADNRLSFPITYWNVLGLLAVFGIVLCVHFSSEKQERIPVRSIAAAALPLLATVVYFTFSRGSIGVGLVALVLYALFVRSAGLLATVLSGGVASAIALKFAYGANLLASAHPRQAGAVTQGKHVALAVGICVLGAGLVRAALALTLEARLSRLKIAAPRRRQLALAGWAALAVVVLAVLALSAGTIRHDYHVFLSSKLPGNSADLRSRLTDPANDGRLDGWRVAWHGFERGPLLGQGAGTFADTYAQHRTTHSFILLAHSLYLETLDELGLVGLALLVATIVLMLFATARRARGPDRAAYAAVFVLILAWALESAVDWDWQMPVVTLVPFVLGGFMLARSPVEARETTRPAERPVSTGIQPQARALIGIGCLLLAVAPAYVWLSQRKLNQATTAYQAGNCRRATSDALSSISILSFRPEPYQVIAYCDIQQNFPRLAVRAMTNAVALERSNWNYSYGLALARAAAGLNPMAAARRALVLDPREPLVQTEWRTFRADTPAEWQGDAKRIADAFNSL